MRLCWWLYIENITKSYLWMRDAQAVTVADPQRVGAFTSIIRIHSQVVDAVAKTVDNYLYESALLLLEAA
jgi:hypothetical protein